MSGVYDPSSKKLLEKLHVPLREPGIVLLDSMLGAFSALPYENITKIIKRSKGRLDDSFRTPDEVVRDHLSLGMGGTCFSLVYLFKALLDYVGFDSSLALADRVYGDNTHCAIMVRFDNRLFLADPGYLIFRPIALEPGVTSRFKTGPYTVEIVPVEEGKYFDLFTVYPNGFRKLRYRLRNSDVDRATFFDCWKRSFEFEMMNYLVVNQHTLQGHLYLRDRHFHAIREGSHEQREMTRADIVALLGAMGMAPQKVEEALAVLGR